MFDLYQYLLRFAAARLAKWKPDFLHLDVFARAVKQIRGIPKGGRASSPTDRLTLRVTNQHTTKQVPLPYFFKNLFPSLLKKKKRTILLSGLATIDFTLKLKKKKICFYYLFQTFIFLKTWWGCYSWTLSHADAINVHFRAVILVLRKIIRSLPTS